jgi:hypothetical protein
MAVLTPPFPSHPHNRAEAKQALHAYSKSDETEKECLLEYYSLVREGKTNYISTLAFHDITGWHPKGLYRFFETYADDFLPERPHKKRKTSSDGGK